VFVRRIKNKMVNILQVVQILLCVLLTGLILIQSKGGGFASSIGNSISFYRSRRGLEKIVFIATIISAAAIVVNSIFLVLLG
jgi:preprotein translocase subunit SecG